GGRVRGSPRDESGHHALPSGANPARAVALRARAIWLWHRHAARAPGIVGVRDVASRSPRSPACTSDSRAVARGAKRPQRILRRRLRSSRCNAGLSSRRMRTRAPSADWLAAHRAAWAQKPSLRLVYTRWFEALRGACAPGDPVLELGCGPGLL